MPLLHTLLRSLVTLFIKPLSYKNESNVAVFFNTIYIIIIYNLNRVSVSQQIFNTSETGYEEFTEFFVVIIII